MTRIISGIYGGLHLLSPKHNIRPTADKVKEYMFNVCRDFEASVTADLFSGTGALGMEALSRGAALVHCVDDHPKSCRLIEDNIVKLGKPEGIHVWKQPVDRFLRGREDSFDYIFADPPYDLELGDGFFRDVKAALKTGGKFILEYRSTWQAGVDFSLQEIKFKKFGETGVWIYE